MHNFDFYWPVRFIAGPGELKKVGIEAKKLGKKAFLVTGKSSMKKLGILDKVTDYLKKEGIEYLLFNEIEPNPRSTTVDKGGRLAKKENCDFVIGLGGGSPMDASKGIALIARSEEGVSIWDYIFCVKNPRPITVVPLPIMLIPTIPATGSEGNAAAVITNLKLHQKVHILHPALFAKVAIIDPKLTLSLTNEQIAYAGVDIICHLLEPYLTCTEEASVKDRMAEGIIIAVFENVLKAIEEPENIQARYSLSIAGNFACSPFRFIGWNGKGYLHWIEHCLSAWTDIPHSEGLSCILISWLTYLSKLKFFSSRLSTFGKRVFKTADNKKIIEQFLKWMKRIKVKIKLDKLSDELINKMADTIMDVYSAGTNIIDYPSGDKYTKEDFEKIYKNAMQGY